MTLENVIAVLTTVLGVAAALGMVLYERRTQQEREEGSRRVRSAEEGLEAALRRNSPEAGAPTQVSEGMPPPPYHVEPDAPGVVTGSAVPVPGYEMRPGSEGRALALHALWSVTHARLDHYHRIALGQAEKSFRNAQIVMGVGFALLVGFSVLALRAETTAASVVAGALGVTAAGLAGYVSRTFVRSQEISAGHLRAYFDQPLEFSRYLAAERLIADVDMSREQRAAVLGELIRTMAAPNGQPSQATQELSNSAEARQQEAWTRFSASGACWARPATRVLVGVAAVSAR
ncbi:hypothetical protein [Streptomyces sp. UG1]|uniref:hypothetical protein n=1 Tax=Streptomyces sp. UG1 TaxID=3417652 RepID=UPI003CF51915